MTPHSFLQSIETRAEGAIAQELAVMTHEVLLVRPTLAIEDREYADCLLLKLDQFDPQPATHASLRKTPYALRCETCRTPIVHRKLPGRRIGRNAVSRLIA